MVMLVGIVLAGCRNKEDCDAKGGPLSAEERTWFVATEQATFKLEGRDSTQVITPIPIQITIVRGSHSVEEHCDWTYESGDQPLGIDLGVYVAHYGIGCEENANSAALSNYYFNDRFSELTAHDHVLINGVEHNGVYVAAGDAEHSLSDIWFSRSEGLLALTKGGERWIRQ